VIERSYLPDLSHIGWQFWMVITTLLIIVSFQLARISFTVLTAHRNVYAWRQTPSHVILLRVLARVILAGRALIARLTLMNARATPTFAKTAWRHVTTHWGRPYVLARLDTRLMDHHRYVLVSISFCDRFD